MTKKGTEAELKVVCDRIAKLQQQKQTLEHKLKSSKGTLKSGEAYVVTFWSEMDQETQYIVFYRFDGDVMCLNGYFDAPSCYISEILADCWKAAYEGDKVSGKKMTLAEACQYL